MRTAGVVNVSPKQHRVPGPIFIVSIDLDEVKMTATDMLAVATSGVTLIISLNILLVIVCSKKTAEWEANLRA
jgi:hypothetical protein